MKDHELRELVNALTATAREYAQTQQLRERIARLVRDAIGRDAECKPDDAICASPAYWVVLDDKGEPLLISKVAVTVAPAFWAKEA